MERDVEGDFNREMDRADEYERQRLEYDLRVDEDVPAPETQKKEPEDEKPKRDDTGGKRRRRRHTKKRKHFRRRTSKHSKK